MDRNKHIYTILFFLILFLGIVLRVYMLRNNLGTTLDSDEAIVGLMAKHIVTGKDYPIFYYGQNYMGSLEAFLAAGIFAIGGVSVFNLKLLMIILFCFFIVITYYLAKSMTNKITALFSILFLAIPPPFFAMYGLKARGGYMETLIFGSLLLLLIVNYEKKMQSANGYLQIGLIAFIAGIALWTDQLIIYYFLPVGIVLSHIFQKHFSFKRLIILFIFFILGSLPQWVFTIIHSGYSLKGIPMIINAHNFMYSIRNFFFQGLPIILGARQAWSQTDFFSYATIVTMSIYGSALLYYLLVRKHIQEYQRRSFDLAILFLFTIPLIFSFSSKAHGFAQEPRYLMPIYSVITIFLGYFIVNLYTRVKYLSIALAIIIILINLVGIMRINPELQLPGVDGVRVNLNDSSFINFLENKHLNAVYADYWIAYRLDFETNEGIIAVPWGENSMDRYPAYHGLIKSKSRYAIILAGTPVLYFEKYLSDKKIIYKNKVIGNYSIYYNFKRLNQIRNKDAYTKLKKVILDFHTFN